MNWDDVRIFLAVARRGQILSAARTLGINHATVSRRLTALEKALGARLVLRRTNGCELTGEGEAFVEAAERMEAAMLTAQAGFLGQDAALSGTVRIGAPDGFGISFLAPRLGRLLTRYPGLHLQLVPVPRVFSLSRREADIAITVERPDQGRVVARKLVDYSLGFYASRGYVAEHGIPQAIEELRQHRLIGYVEDLVFSRVLNFAEELPRDVRATFEISSAVGQAEAVRSGAGIGILHDFTARHDPDFVHVLRGHIFKRAYWIVYHENARGVARVKAVSDFVMEEVAAARDGFLPDPDMANGDVLSATG
ncbi:LysR family transcriptional regulator [Georhizobium profundi]|uniref:LysR family transcriptional regulator n=1 Tax=Georhizobium profundi TaxID=2341112 RepID=A0A3S9B538_9HYPH|nr:LysR family transcriptional regulator [Georhizobium profundi]AZN72075.1 LysR family transcriptional regulator [Georhizobium profundi]